MSQEHEWHVILNMITSKWLVGLGVLAVTLASFSGGSVYAAEKEKGPKATSQINVACLQSAIDTRDNGMITAVGAYHTSIVTALQTRRDAMKTAVALTDRVARRNASQAAVNAFRKSRLSATNTLRASKKTVWNTFAVARKACGVGATSENHGSQGMDNSL